VLTDLVFRDLPNPLFLAPVREPIRVLDCGHGSGAWVVEVAESYPDCEVMFFSSNVAASADLMEVIGVDFSPIMNPDDIPENLHLQVRVANPSVVSSIEAHDTGSFYNGDRLTVQLRRSQTCTLGSLAAGTLHFYPLQTIKRPRIQLMRFSSRSPT
jgi:hypothetical protein